MTPPPPPPATKFHPPAPHPGYYHAPYPPHGYPPMPPPHPAYGYPYHPPPPPPRRKSSQTSPPTKQQQQQQPPKTTRKKRSSKKVAPEPPAINSKPQTILTHHDHDILMGRGGKNNSHVGNEKLREMARAVTEVYKKASKKEKSRMAWDLIEQVKQLNPPGRFLRRIQDTGAWEEVPVSQAREKAGQCLRDAVATNKGPPPPTVSSTASSSEIIKKSVPPPLVSSSSASINDDNTVAERPSTPVSLHKHPLNVIEESPVADTTISRRSSVSFKMEEDDNDDAMDTSSSSSAPKRQRLGTWDKVVRSGGDLLAQFGEDLDASTSHEGVMRARLGTWDRESAGLSHSNHVIPMDQDPVLVGIDQHTGAPMVMMGNDLEEWLEEGLHMDQEELEQPNQPMYTDDEDVFYTDFF
ncbi:expressed unknown protein [Seminavis robusta]|uniref:DUF6824 domain-containing protein n=1 Tax=Seminavis robusta TaxID=568900 RepID=A0A9N8EDU4_9STRA|nr:expressed unknown protein [Seminavis robusta]|eukprot:Sro945_g223130.1 n/a (410) ;mRNA; r:20387-21712